MQTDTMDPKKTTRRGFLATTGKAISTLYLLSVAGVSLLATGCSLLADIETWVPVGLAAFQSVVDLLAGAGVINPVEGSAIDLIIGKVKQGFAQIVADIAQYGKNVPPNATFLQKLQTVLGIVVSNMQAFFASFNVTNNKLLALIVGLAQIILGTIAGFQTKLQAAGAPAPSVQASRTARAAGQPITVVAHVRSRDQFTKDFNAACADGGHPEIQIH